jgi:hypothetical protein
MRERIPQLGGSSEIRSPTNGKGTIIIARLPESWRAHCLNRKQLPRFHDLIDVYC